LGHFGGGVKCGLREFFPSRVRKKNWVGAAGKKAKKNGDRKKEGPPAGGRAG